MAVIQKITLQNLTFSDKWHLFHTCYNSMRKGERYEIKYPLRTKPPTADYISTVGHLTPHGGLPPWVAARVAWLVIRVDFGRKV